MLREVWPLTRKLLGDEHPETAGIMSGLASAIAAQKRYSEATELMREVV